MRVEALHTNNTFFFYLTELIAQGWAMAMQWMGLAVRVMVWLGTLTVDVVVMSSRLLLHLLVVAWARLLEYWTVAGLTIQHYWTRLIGLFSKKEKEEKKLPGECHHLYHYCHPNFITYYLE